MLQLKHIHFIVYACVFVLYGSLVTAVGPIIIYFSQITGEDETYYSFIFLARALGYILGGSLIKVLSHRFHYHTLFMWLIVLCGIVLIWSSFSLTFLNLSITMLLAAACSCMMNILCNLCIFQLFVGDCQDYWIQMINLFFGVGGLVGPIITIHFEHHAMRAIGIMMFFLIIPFLFLQSPETHKTEQSHQQKKKMLELKRLPQVCICLLFFFYIAEEVGYANWIPTYAVKAEVAGPDEASALASYFWITNTIARLVLLYLPGSVTDRLRLLLKALLISTIIVLGLQWMGHLKLVSYLGVISSGLFLSAMYALFFSIAIDYGFGLSPSNTANFAMSASLGEGMLVMPIGYAMGFFGYKALIYIIVLFSGTMYFLFQYLVVKLTEDSNEGKKEINIPLQPVSEQL